MPIRHRLRTIACCAMLQVGTLLGVPVRPEQVQDAMRMLNEPKLASVNPDDSDNGAGNTPTPSHEDSEN